MSLSDILICTFATKFINKMNLKINIIVLIAIVVFSACKKNKYVTRYTKTASCGNNTPTYLVTVKPLLEINCNTIGCHTAASKRGGIQLDSYTSAKDDFQNGKSLCTIYHDCKPMPQSRPKMSDADIKTLTCWVKNGCPE
jgi:hypothetical protein